MSYLLISRKTLSHRFIALLSVMLFGAFTSLAAQAATMNLNLERTSTLTVANDAEGRWQLDGGKVLMGESLVGYYTRKKRISFAVPASVNKSAVEITVFWASGNYSFTLQGSQSMSDGSQVGSVSAGSAGFTAMHDAVYSGTTNQLTIYY